MAVMKRPPSSDSAAEEITNLMIWAIVKVRSVEARNWIVFREEDVSSHAAAGFADVEVGSVGMGGGNHLAGSIDNSIVRVGGDIVEELVDG